MSFSVLLSCWGMGMDINTNLLVKCILNLQIYSLTSVRVKNGMKKIGIKKKVLFYIVNRIIDVFGVLFMNKLH